MNDNISIYQLMPIDDADKESYRFHILQPVNGRYS